MVHRASYDGKPVFFTVELNCLRLCPEVCRDRAIPAMGRVRRSVAVQKHQLQGRTYTCFYNHI